MSDALEIKLNHDEYNGLHQALGNMIGLGPCTAATTVQDLIANEARNGIVTIPATDKKPEEQVFPQNIIIKVERKVLDVLYIGLQELSKKDKITVPELLQIKGIAVLLKMKNRIEKHIKNEFDKSQVVIDEAFDSEIIEEPFDS